MKYFKKDGKIKIKTVESPNKDELKKIKEDGSQTMKWMPLMLKVGAGIQRQEP